MKETNKHILIEAINNLPQYEPKASLWDAIDQQLTVEEKEAGLKQSLQELPVYNPPAMVWDTIESKLNEAEKPVARVFNIRRWASVAAVFAMVTIGTLLFYNTTNENGEYVAVTYSEEPAAAAFLTVDWEADEDAFAMVTEFCKTDQPICRQPDFKILTEELDELNAARNELKEAMDNFGNDPDLIAQLTVIEHERSDLLKQIIKRI